MESTSRTTMLKSMEQRVSYLCQSNVSCQECRMRTDPDSPATKCIVSSLQRLIGNHKLHRPVNCGWPDSPKVAQEWEELVRVVKEVCANSECTGEDCPLRVYGTTYCFGEDLEDICKAMIRTPAKTAVQEITLESAITQLLALNETLRNTLLGYALRTRREPVSLGGDTYYVCDLCKVEGGHADSCCLSWESSKLREQINSVIQKGGNDNT